MFKPRDEEGDVADAKLGLHRLFDQDLTHSTDNFSKGNLIGTGYCWKLYRGIIDQVGMGGGEPVLEVTIKLWDDAKDENRSYFEDEMRLLKYPGLGCLPIIPKLVGYCCEENILALVYDFASLNTLQDNLCDEKFHWVLRVKAALEIARGLEFLHQLSPPFILRNLHPAHIMLDKDFSPKLFDFGLGSGGLFGDRTGSYRHAFDSNEFKNFHVGYSGVWSTESDVFDFGILLMALGAKTTVPKENIHIYHIAHSHEGKDMFHGHPDFLSDEIDYSDLNEIWDLALLCVKLRPVKLCSTNQWNMSDIVAYLEGLHVIRRCVWLERGMKHPAIMYSGFPTFEYPSSLSSEYLNSLTDKFSEANLLDHVNVRGYLSCGKVYHGRKREQGRNNFVAQEVTVKIWDNPGGHIYYEDELMCLTLPRMSSHPNLARLIGYCNEKGMLGVVYDLAPKSTLRRAITQVSFCWRYRINAALGIARALAFLHDQNPPFLHRNLDPAHIMLDKDYNPKLFEFALGSGGPLGDRVTFHRFEGPMGFKDPAHFGDTWNPSCDIYAFGLILLALLARKSVTPCKPSDSHIVLWFREQKRDIVHNIFKGTPEYDDDDGDKVKALALCCVDVKVEGRPKSMNEVISALEKLSLFKKCPSTSRLEMLPKHYQSEQLIPISWE